MLDALLRSSLQAAALIVLLWSAFKLCPRISPSIQIWLWRLVFVKLVFGLVNIVPIQLAILPPPPPLYVSEQVQTPAETFIQEATSAIPAMAPMPAQSTPVPEPSIRDLAAVAAAPKIDPSALLIGLWFSGVILIGAIAARSSFALASIARKATPITDPEALAMLSDLSLGLKVRAPKLAASGETDVPMLVGITRPMIVLPADGGRAFTLEEQRLVLAHELAHLVRRDLVWSWFNSVVQALFFFNPLVWIAARHSNLAQESAADLMALRLTHVEPRMYGELLVKTALSNPSSSLAGPTGLAMGESYHTLARRLENMKSLTLKSSPIRSIGTLALAATAVCALPTFSLAQSKDQEIIVVQGSDEPQVKTITLQHANGKVTKVPATYIVKSGNTTTKHMVVWTVSKDGKTKKLTLKQGDKLKTLSGTIYLTDPSKAKKGVKPGGHAIKSLNGQTIFFTPSTGQRGTIDPHETVVFGSGDSNTVVQPGSGVIFLRPQEQRISYVVVSEGGKVSTMQAEPPEGTTIGKLVYTEGHAPVSATYVGKTEIIFVVDGVPQDQSKEIYVIDSKGHKMTWKVTSPRIRFVPAKPSDKKPEDPTIEKKGDTPPQLTAGSGKIPFLSDLPIMGQLFRTTDRVRNPVYVTYGTTLASSKPVNLNYITATGSQPYEVKYRTTEVKPQTVFLHFSTTRVAGKPITVKYSTKTIKPPLLMDVSTAGHKVPVLGDVPILGRLFTTDAAKPPVVTEKKGD